MRIEICGVSKLNSSLFQRSDEMLKFYINLTKLFDCFFQSFVTRQTFKPPDH